jgi:hypothetical protein
MSLKNKHSDFVIEIEERGIEHLIHFTPTLNLYSILEQKQLMSRSVLESLDIDQYDILDYVQFTDNVRYDDKRYINLSVLRPALYGPKTADLYQFNLGRSVFTVINYYGTSQIAIIIVMCLLSLSHLK